MKKDRNEKNMYRRPDDCWFRNVEKLDFGTRFGEERARYEHLGVQASQNDNPIYTPLERST